MHLEDPNLVVTINQETGETLLSGMGVLHLEIATTLIQDQGIEIVTSKTAINIQRSYNHESWTCNGKKSKQTQQSLHKSRAP